MGRQYNRLASLQAIVRFEAPRRLPAGQHVSFEELARSCSVQDLPVFRRLLRHAMAFGVFREPRKGFVAPSAQSRALVDRPGLADWLAMVGDEMWPAATRVRAVSFGLPCPSLDAPFPADL